MASDDLPPRFFKVFISHFSSQTMMIPMSYYDELPNHLPKTAMLHGTGGGCWKVAMKIKDNEVHFEQGWTKFIQDNSLKDGDFMTFVYDGDCNFEVSIYGADACKETRAIVEGEDDKEHSIYSLSSNDTSSESEMNNMISRSKDKGKMKEGDSDDKEDSVYSVSSEATETDTDVCSESKMAKAKPESRNKGKAKEDSSDEEDSDSDYIEAFGRLDFSEEEDSESDESSYSPKKKIIKKNPKKKDVVATTSHDSVVAEPGKKAKKGKKALKVRAKIKNPEAYLDDPNNVYFETAVKNRKYELLVHAQLVKDYCLKFKDHVTYIDRKGELVAKTAKWHDHRVCIKKWIRICERNKLKKEDRILCELLRERGLVYAIKLHIVRGKDL